MTPRIVATLLPLLLTTSAEAVQLHFEAWPTPSSETCPAPCYEMRMFLQINPRDTERIIQAIQMDIDIGAGAIATQLPVPPQRNDNAGPGNVHARYDGTRIVGVPWNLASVVGSSPNAGFDALMIHAADATFTVEGVAELVDDPSTSCANVNQCSFVSEALALNRVYLGFMNVTRSAELPPGVPPGHGHAGPPFGYEHSPPPGVPFFTVYVANITGNGDAVEALARGGGGAGSVEYLPEPSTGFVLPFALAMLVAMRLRA
jgi:hypothetical protein